MKGFPFFVAWRYLFSKKRHNAINVISIISVVGVALSTMALVCTLSVFNGFRDLISSLYTAFDPQLEVVPAKGKFVAADDSLLLRIKAHPDVAVATESLEENALILFQGHPTVIVLKGVSENFDSCTDIRSILLGDGDFLLHAGGVDYGVPGIGLAQQLGGIDYGKVPICAPRKGERINTINPSESFTIGDLISPRLVFHVSQRQYDDHYLLAPLSFAQELFEQEGCITSLELRLKDGADTDDVKQQLRAIAGNRFQVNDRIEQQQDMFAVMNLEKTVSYLFLTFILLVSCFNIIGSVSMLIIEKRSDMEVLRHLGADEQSIVRIFLYEGWLITLLGAIVGIGLGLALCLLQEQFGLLRLGNAEGMFIVDAYPVSVHLPDILLIFATVLVVGACSVWYPVHHLSKRLL
ncbi:MAG: FtsX-like permease family protein [Bacteroidaceae bacterium]|nr:FtsX-like permease family protein [Bacteroidaceae bacterium]